MSGLVITGLRVDLPGRPGVVDGVELTVAPGRVLALVGPSGAGKSLTLRAVARLLPREAVAGGSVLLDGVDLFGLDARALRRVRGRLLGCVFQNATASLNPTMTVGGHVVETVRAQRPVSRSQARAAGLAGLGRAGLEDPAALWDAYPFQLSGGQAQRVALALATVGDPPMLLADEITTELDVVTQAGVLDVLREQAGAGRGVLLVTHDLAVAARWADDVVVMAAGRVIENGPATVVLTRPQAALTHRLVELARLTAEALP